MNLKLLNKRVRKGLTALGEPTLRRGLTQGVLSAVEHLPVLRQLPPMDVVIDGGANIGQFALVARAAFPEATIVSFEPLPAPFESLEGLFANDDRHRAFNVALSSEAGTVQFHMTGANDSSSILPTAQRQRDEFTATSVAEVIEVRTERLDTAMAEILDAAASPEGERPRVLLKLDTQGTELDAIHSAGELLDRVDHIIVEASFVELYVGQCDAAGVTTHLVEQGWRLAAVYDVKASSLNGEPLQADFLFSRP